MSDVQPVDDLRAFSYKEAAERLSLSEVQVKRLCYAKKLASFKVGSRTLIPASSLREFLTQSRA